MERYFFVIVLICSQYQI